MFFSLSLSLSSIRSIRVKIVIVIKLNIHNDLSFQTIHILWLLKSGQSFAFDRRNTSKFLAQINIYLFFFALHFRIVIIFNRQRSWFQMKEFRKGTIHNLRNEWYTFFWNAHWDAHKSKSICKRMWTMEMNTVFFTALYDVSFVVASHSH